MRATPAILALGTAGAVVAVTVGVAAATSGSEVERIGPVAVGDVTLAPEATSTADATLDPTPDATGDPTTGPAGGSTRSETSGTSGTQAVTGLDQVAGVLTRDDFDDDDDLDDDDRYDFEVAGIDLELGPDSWLSTAGPIADFDGDGTEQAVLLELEGLLGQEVAVATRLDDDGDDGDDLDVYEIKGLTFRDSAGGPAPWRTSTDGGAPLSRDEAGAAALTAVGPGSRIDSVDREDDGARWEVEVVDAQGREQDVLLDAQGVVLDIREDG